MKRLALAVIAAAVLWSGWWFYAAAGLRGEIESWFEARRGDGWQAQYEKLSVRGFPNRLDATLTGVVLADPESGLAWQAPFFQILQLVYKQGHEILIWPDSQTLRVNGGEYAITSDGLRASLVHDAEGVIDRANLEATSLNIAGPEGGVALAGLTTGLQAVPSRPATYRLGLAADAVAGPQAGLVPRPDRVDALALRAEITFDAPWTTAAPREARPQPTQIDLRLAEYQVDGVELKLAGRLDVDAAGRGDGEVTLRMVNWRDLMERLRENQQMSGGLLAALEQGLSLTSQLTGDGTTLDVTLRVDEGQMSLGLIPLGPAPLLRLP